MRYIFILFLLLTTTVKAQESWDDFTGSEKAFFYRITRTTDILDRNLFHLFEFTDSIPYINDTLPDYKYVEKKIVQDGDRLIFHSNEVSRISSGLISDLATHFALWELGQVIHYRQSTAESDKPLKEKLKVFEEYVRERAPQSAIGTKSDGSYVLRNSLASYYTHSLSCHDKIAAMKNSGFVQLDQMLCLNAITYATNKYVENRSKEIFKVLGGEDEEYKNYLSVAGDGVNYSELEFGYKSTPQNHQLPQNIGLFNFRLYMKEEKPIGKKGKAVPDGDKPIKKNIAVRDIVSREFKTSPGMSTVLHFDVYGWHKKRQTTIVIQKGGKSYILYGNNDNRLLSPDSTYGEGTTYRRLMWELEHVHIAELKEKLYGKRGYEYWIEEYEKKIQNTLLAIKKTEHKLNKLRHKPQKTPKVKKKKWRKIDLSTSDQDGKGHPTDGLTRTQKKINIEQNRLNFLMGQLASEKQMLAQLKKEMEEAYFILVSYENKLDFMRKNLGLLEMEHEEENEFFTFRDGATFNKRTQDFTFPPNGSTEGFKVLHISFGEKVFSTGTEESFVHIHKTKQHRKEKYVYQRLTRDRDGRNPEMTDSDSIQTMEIFKALLDEETEIEMIPIAGGIKGEGDGEVFRKETLQPKEYRKDSPKEGVTIYRADYDVKLKMYVEVYSGQMKPYNFEENYPKFEKFNKKNPKLNEIDYYTGSRALQTAYMWKLHLQKLVPEWFEDPEEQKEILSKLKKIKPKKAFFNDGQKEIKVPFVKPENG